MTKILVEGINLYAYHGCMKEESVIGGNYIVDICMEADMSKPAKTDNLNDALDYVTVYEIVKKEMAVRSKLIEHVAKRIINKLKKQFPKTDTITIKLTKLNPPIEGDVEKVSVVISE